MISNGYKCEGMRGKERDRVRVRQKGKEIKKRVD